MRVRGSPVFIYDALLARKMRKMRNKIDGMKLNHVPLMTRSPPKRLEGISKKNDLTIILSGQGHRAIRVKEARML